MDDRYYRSLESQVKQASISDEEWGLFLESTSVKHIKKGIRLIKAGDFVNCAYFCSEGLFRLFYTLADGREYNVSFSLEGDYVTSYAAMITGERSGYSIEAMEDSVVIEIGNETLEELMAQNCKWERFVRKCVERLYIKKEERERQLLYLSAKERYTAFLDKYPGLEKRIPQYHIASYIGISPVSLSRLLGVERR